MVAAPASAAARRRSEPRRSSAVRGSPSRGSIRAAPSVGGQVRVDGEIWNARSTEPIDPGASVIVAAVDGLVLEVEPAPPL